MNFPKFTQPDHPFVRARHECPLCGGAKSSGLLCCWPCYNRWNIKAGISEADALIEEAERVWRGEAQGTEIVP